MDFQMQAASKLNKKIRITKHRWELITKIKHPIMEGKEKEVKSVLENPDEVRQSISDKSVFLYYRKHGRHSICTVVKHENGEGFIITAYITDRIKEGNTIFKR